MKGMVLLWICGILMAMCVQSGQSGQSGQPEQSGGAGGAGGAGVAGRGLLVIPGLGRKDRLETVLWNLRALEKSGFRYGYVRWDCVVYIYAPREDRAFWDCPMKLLYDLCSVVEVPNQLVTQNLVSVCCAVLCAVCCVLCAGCCILYTLYSILHTLYSIL
jgi:hypothetical protein